MKFLKYILLLVLAVSHLSAPAFADDAGQDDSDFKEELNERDFDALRDFLKSRRMKDVAEKKSNLIISGDVRTEYRHLNESACGKKLRGRGLKTVNARGLPISCNDFDMECNLYFNCVYERSWAVAHVRYDNSAGVDDNDHPCRPANQNDTEPNCKTKPVKRAAVCNGDPDGFHGSGRDNDLHLKKAFFGYNFYLDDNARFDIELGRRGNLYNVFTSNIQFLSRFDGILFKYDASVECFVDWYVHAAGFVVDERVNHFAWIIEAGLLNIRDSNVDFIYSIIDWEKNGKNRCGQRKPLAFRSINSQFTVIYNIAPTVFSKPIKLYGAFLINHAAQKMLLPDYENRSTLPNIGWYAGILIGKVRKEGDWALEIQYQYVQANAMPEQDCGGICRGNVLDESITSCSRRGETNFKGWRVEALYGFTDQITLDTIVEHSKAADARIGGRHTYSKFELEAIYAF